MQFKQLTESVGFPNRKSGDEFYNPKQENDKVTFQELILWPDGAVQYDTPEQRDEALQRFQEQVQGKIFILNKPNNGMLGLYIVHMINVSSEDEYYIKYVKSVANTAGILNSIPANIKGTGHGGYKFGSVSARKEAYAIKPSDIFTSEAPMSPDAIAGAIAAAQGIPEDLKAQMTNYLMALAKGNKNVIIQDGHKYKTVHENYTGEFAAPIAVITGQVTPEGSRLKAEQVLLGGERFANCKIVFPTSATEKLIDSKLVAPNGRTVGISSKAKSSGGAAASLAGLWDTIQQKRDDQDFQKVMSDYTGFIRLVETVVTMSAEAGLIQVCLESSLIDQQDASTLAEGIKKAKAGSKSTLEELTPRLQNLVSSYGADTDNPRYNIIYHATAALSRQLSIKLDDLNPTQAVKELLNFSTMTQVYAGTSKTGEDIKMDTFKFVWPPQYEGKVVIDTAKNFTATEIRGKIGFKFK